MPEMGGIDVLISLQERPGPRPDGKIIVLSALVTPHMVEHLQQLGAHRVVTKPFHIDELLKTVEEVAQIPAEIQPINSGLP
ncbi:MAG: response regulator transcription factor, partial [Chloroflexi bacterium]|nr:response regulator transcription factor [Chloroflexota bacterium]